MTRLRPFFHVREEPAYAVLSYRKWNKGPFFWMGVTLLAQLCPLGGRQEQWIIDRMAPDHDSRSIDVLGDSGTMTMSRSIRDPVNDTYTGPQGGILRHTTTGRADTSARCFCIRSVCRSKF